MKKNILATCLALTTFNALASEDELWDEAFTDDTNQEESWDEESNWSGYLETAYGYRIHKDPLFDNQQTLNETKLYLERSETFADVELSFKGEARYDGVLKGYQADVRELALNFSAFGNTDFKIGRQVSTWGTGDLLFVNDQFPKGWKGYFNGRDDVYVKAPANALRMNSYFDSFNFNLVWTPKFTADDYINGERFSFYSPQLEQNVGGQDVVNESEPESKISNGELAVRIYKTIQGTEYAIYGYRGFDKRPLGQSEDFRPTFHKRTVYGASVRGNLAEGLYNIEATYENALEDQNGSDPKINNSLYKLLVGYEMELLPKLNMSFQYYLEWIDDYKRLINNSPYPQLETSEKRTWLTNRISYRAMQDKLTWTFFTFYSPTDKDYFLRWNVNYRQDDNWAYTLGLNYIDGEKEHTFFNQFSNASNVYARIRYNF